MVIKPATFLTFLLTLPSSLLKLPKVARVAARGLTKCDDSEIEYRLTKGYLFQRLKQLTKRQVDLNFEQLVQRYQAKQKEQEEIAFKAKYVESKQQSLIFAHDCRILFSRPVNTNDLKNKIDGLKVLF